MDDSRLETYPTMSLVKHPHHSSCKYRASRHHGAVSVGCHQAVGRGGALFVLNEQIVNKRAADDHVKSYISIVSDKTSCISQMAQHIYSRVNNYKD